MFCLPVANVSFILIARSESLNTRCCRPSPDVPTLSPGMGLWARKRKRLVLGLERLALQGMSRCDINVENLRNSSDQNMQKLAGDMFNLISYSIVLDSILACVCLPLS